MRGPEVEQKTAISFDGTTIAYQVRGEGPAVVLANGLGGTYSTYRHQYAMFGDQYKVISWDYRGLFRSGRPPSLDSLAISEQVKDLEIVLELEGVDRALFIGWSMGVQFNFEYFRDHSDQFAGLVVLNGVSGRPFETAFPGLPVKKIVPILVSGMKLGAPVIGPITSTAGNFAAPMLLPLFKLAGLAADSLDEDVLLDLVSEYGTLDFAAYGETLAHLGLHDASDVLPRITIPTLIVTGTKDFFTPMATVQQMVAAMPASRQVVVEGGSHYTAVEFPDQVNAHLQAYMKRIGYGPLGQ